MKMSKFKEYHVYPIFLSSLCRELSELRARIFEDVGQGRYIYVDEKVKWRNIQTQDDLETIDELIKRVREADIFVCILGGNRHGSPIRVDLRPSVVSFFEIELFQAALLDKEVHILIREDFNPEPRLRKLLDILEFKFPEWINKERLTNEEIVDYIKRLVDKRISYKIHLGLKYIHTPISRLVQALFSQRTKITQRSSQLFLEGKFESYNRLPNDEILERLWIKISSLPNEEKRLARLWLMIRELMSAPYTTIDDKTLLEWWNKTLAEWARAGAWYGLHGHTPMGCLYALNSLTLIRNRLAKRYKSQLPPDSIVYPGGALASAKYSIAKRLYIIKR